MPVMAPDPLAAVPAPVRWLMHQAAPGEEALALVPQVQALEGLVQAWQRAGHTPEVVRVVAALLPPREGAWWGWVSVRHALQGGAPPATAPMHTAMAAVERWIGQPDDDHRRAVWAAAEGAGMDTPVGMVAAAVFLGPGSVAPAGVAPVPPPPGAAPALVAGAILLSAAMVQPAEQAAVLLGAFVAQGLDIVRRLGGWDPALAAAYERHQRAVAAQQAAVAPPSAPPGR
jgi:hypothetical protein